MFCCCHGLEDFRNVCRCHSLQQQDKKCSLPSPSIQVPRTGPQASDATYGFIVDAGYEPLAPCSSLVPVALQLDMQQLKQSAEYEEKFGEKPPLPEWKLAKMQREQEPQ